MSARERNVSAATSDSSRATDGNPWALPDGGAWRWFRGNLHCHTTASDGRLTPQQTVDWFAAAGYHFLALTDHNRITDPATVDARGLCLLPATELTAAGGELGAAYHLIALGLPVDMALPQSSTAAVESLRRLRERGAVVFIAHPHWSGLTVADLLALNGDPALAGIEIYNGGSVLDSQKGEALAHWDEALARGARWWGIAVDDTHWHTLDRGLGWVMVRAPVPHHSSPGAQRSPPSGGPATPELSPAALLHALARGHFYASSGPEIRRLHLAPDAEGGKVVEVETSPCAAIYVLGYGSRNQFAFDREAAARGELGATINRATFRVRAGEARGTGPAPYVRVQCVDWQRRCAWTNPLFLV